MNKIKDTKDRTWRLAVTIGAVQTYEEMADIKVFQKLFELWKKYRDTTDYVMSILAVVADLFPGITEAAQFCYACATLEGANAKPGFDEFCEVVGPVDCGAAVIGLSQKLKEFMPEENEDLKRGKGPDGARPLER